jgi:hypothetical protein
VSPSKPPPGTGSSRPVEQIVNRQVVAFASAIDPDHDVVWEVFNFKPADPQTDGRRNMHPDTEPS